MPGANDHRWKWAARVAKGLIAFTVAWLLLAVGLEPSVSMSSSWRYRSLEDRDFATAETIDTISLSATQLATHVAIPGAARMEAVALARLAETKAEEGELDSAKRLYERAIAIFEEFDPSDDDLRAVRSNYAVLLREVGMQAD